jgi:alpha-D-ribose 1-methylphosphonate 5-triphosphate diphosphatase
MIAKAGLAPLPVAVGLVTSGPAKVAGLTDRGRLVPGLRADLVLVEPAGNWPVIWACLRAADAGGDPDAGGKPGDAVPSGVTVGRDGRADRGAPRRAEDTAP